MRHGDILMRVSARKFAYKTKFKSFKIIFTECHRDVGWKNIFKQY
jgi:hypothetical protein